MPLRDPSSSPPRSRPGIVDDRDRSVPLVTLAALGPSAPPGLHRRVIAARKYGLRGLLIYPLVFGGVLHVVSAVLDGQASSWVTFFKYTADQLRILGVVLLLLLPGYLGFLIPLCRMVLGPRARRAAAEECRVCRRCASCGYDLAALLPDPDGCTTCPECAAAWRLPLSPPPA